MINVHKVSKYYGTKAVVNNVSLTIPKGGITSLIGPNGAGKSTLLSIISRLMKMDSGQVTIDGLDITQTPSEILAQRLAILRQDNHMTARISVRDLVAFGRYPYNKGRPTLEDKEHLERALAYLDLEPLAGRYLDELSGGQRQRAFVAMVLCQDTDYLLLDEPLNNLDMKHSASMMRLLHRAAHELGKTIVVVLHDINFASCYSDTIIALRDGQLIHQGTPAEIITTAALQDIYAMDINIHQIGGKRIALFY